MRLHAIVVVALAVMSLPAAAHDMSKLGPKGGQLAHWASNHYELLPEADGVRLYLYAATDENRPADATRASATGRFIVAGKLHVASFAPVGGNAMLAKGVVLAGDWTALVKVALPGKTAANVRFTAGMMAVQAKASAEQKQGQHAHH
jgi:hypothetical protein